MLWLASYLCSERLLLLLHKGFSPEAADIYALTWKGVQSTKCRPCFQGKRGLLYRGNMNKSKEANEDFIVVVAYNLRALRDVSTEMEKCSQ